MAQCFLPYILNTIGCMNIILVIISKYNLMFSLPQTKKKITVTSVLLSSDFARCLEDYFDV